MKFGGLKGNWQNNRSKGWIRIRVKISLYLGIDGHAGMFGDEINCRISTGSICMREVI